MTLKTVQTDDGSYSLYSEAYAQTFHSHKGALSESKHVFLAASGLYDKAEKSQDCCVLEVGFGTGLNFFLSAEAYKDKAAHLEFSSLEKDLLSTEVLESLNFTSIIDYPELFEAYKAWRLSLPSDVPEGVYRFSFKNIVLKLYIGEATTQSLPPNYADALYMDAFSPEENPELWTDSFFSLLKASMKEGAALSSYCVKGDVRRRLAALGFKVEKLKGPVGGKREMLRAYKMGEGIG